jgi:hypothetical protein
VLLKLRKKAAEKTLMLFVTPAWVARQNGTEKANEKYDNTTRFLFL